MNEYGGKVYIYNVTVYNKEKEAIDMKKHLIEKFIDIACEYLDDTLYEVVSGIYNGPNVMSIENTTMEEFISNFRKTIMDKI